MTAGEAGEDERTLQEAAGVGGSGAVAPGGPRCLCSPKYFCTMESRIKKIVDGNERCSLFRNMTLSPKSRFRDGKVYCELKDYASVTYYPGSNIPLGIIRTYFW